MGKGPIGDMVHVSGGWWDILEFVICNIARVTLGCRLQRLLLAIFLFLLYKMLRFQ